MGGFCSCCGDRKPRMPVVDWDKLRKRDDKIAESDDMRVAPPKSVGKTSTTNIKTPLLSSDDHIPSGATSIDPNTRSSLQGAEIQTLSVRYQQEQLREIALKLRDTLDIQDRKFRVKVYHKCFIAAEMVSTLIKLKIAETEQEAVEIGHSLHYFQYITHVTDDNKLFKNKTDRFWKFIDSNLNVPVTSSPSPGPSAGASAASPRDAAAAATTPDDASGPVSGGTGPTPKISDGGGSFDSRANALSTYLGPEAAGMNASLSAGESGDEDYDEMTSELSATLSHAGPAEETEELLRFREMRDGMIKFLELKDQKWMLKLYRECATGSDVCNVLIKNLGVAKTRSEAVQMGQKMVELRLCVHVSHKRKIKFEDDKELFLHFINFDVSGVDDLWRSGGYALKLKLIPKLNIKDRIWVAKKYEKCFKGTGFVKALKQIGVAMTSLHAREIGTELIRLGYIEHVARDQKRMWNNPQMWYRFV